MVTVSGLVRRSWKPLLRLPFPTEYEQAVRRAGMLAMAHFAPWQPCGAGVGTPSRKLCPADRFSPEFRI
jgi:hypothetical protein